MRFVAAHVDDWTWLTCDRAIDQVLADHGCAIREIFGRRWLETEVGSKPLSSLCPGDAMYDHEGQYEGSNPRWPRCDTRWLGAVPDSGRERQQP